MAKINKSPKKDAIKSKNPKKKNKLEKSDATTNKNAPATIDSQDVPSAKKQITKKPKTKSNGMKQAVKLIISDKKKKHKKKPLPEVVAAAAAEDEELREPTAEELMESEKPENTKAILTVRQKKRLKHQQRLEEQKNKCPNKDIARNEEYLLKWKNNRDEWKFEKLRQIDIQLSVFDDAKISAELWPIALEYLSGSKGAAKEKTTKAAEAVIDELDKEAEKVDDSTLITSSEKYRRARQLLQSFD